MRSNSFRVTVFVVGIALLAGSAAASAKIIHVPSALGVGNVPNPPASEDEAAGMRGSAEGMPRVIRLMGSMSAKHRLMPAAVGSIMLAAEPCPAAEEVTWSFYSAEDAVYGSRIVFPVPAWDSSRFLPAAGWSERPWLWASHGRY